MGYHTERMAGIGYGVAFGRRRQLTEDPRFFPELLVVCTRPNLGGRV